MQQAGRILAGSKDHADIITREKIVCGAWANAVGKRLASYTRAVKLVRERLVVEVEDEIWRSSLYTLRFQILRSLEKSIGPGIVADLQFTVMPPRREPQRATSTQSPAPQLFDEAESIPDPGLRRIYRQSRRRETA